MSTQSAADVTARDIMVRKVICLTPDQDLFDVIDLLVRNKISGAPVIDAHGKYIGIFSERSSISLLVDAVQRGTPTNRIEPFVDRDAISVTPDTDLWTIAQTLMTTHYRRLPVVEHGRVVGVISRRDVLREANKLIQPPQKLESSTLYLSSTRKREDAPVV